MSSILKKLNIMDDTTNPIQHFQIQPDLPSDHCYKAGDEIRGKVHLFIEDSSVPVNGIKLRLLGKAKVNWKEQESTGRNIRYVSNEELIVDKTITLVGGEMEEWEMNFIPGNYTYRFLFTLPTCLPSILREKNCEIKYYLKAVIQRTKKSDFVVRFPIRIQGVLDLNFEPLTESGAEASKEEIFCCFCCANGPLGFLFKLHKTGYVPGEKIGFSLHMYNYSNQKVTSTTVTLIQELKLTAGKNISKTKSAEITRVFGPLLSEQEGTTDWIVSQTDSTLIVPSELSSFTLRNGIIRISYFIQVKMNVDLSLTIKENIPIVIGTLSLSNKNCLIENVFTEQPLSILSKSNLN